LSCTERSLALFFRYYNRNNPTSCETASEFNVNVNEFNAGGSKIPKGTRAREIRNSLEQFKNFEIKGKVLYGSIMDDIVQIRKVCVISTLTERTRKQFSAESRKNELSENAFIYHLKLGAACFFKGYFLLTASDMVLLVTF
jgi:hypothetical protein